jgi:hypothetical protein
MFSSLNSKQMIVSALFVFAVPILTYRLVQEDRR